jgi:twinkle protein
MSDAPSANGTPSTPTTEKPESSGSPSQPTKPSFGIVTTASPVEDAALPISQAHALRLRERGMNPVLCARLGVRSMGPAIGFQYLLNGLVHNTKIRHGKGNMPWEKPGKPLVAYGIDLLRDDVASDEFGIITEGEFDAISCIQCGYTRTISVPNGAQAGEGGFNWLYVGDDIHPDIDKFKTWVIFTDDDKEGRACRDALAVRLGEERCSWVKLPEGCKDANDVLRVHGENRLREVIEQAKPLWRERVATIDDIPEPGPEPQYRCGLVGLDAHGFRITLPSLWCIVGPYHVGKSVMLRQLTINFWRLHKWRVLLSAFEEKPKPRMVRDLRRHLIGQGYFGEPWTRQAIEDADNELRNGVRFLLRPKRKELEPGYVLETIETAVKKDDVRVVILDPMNEIAIRASQGQTKTDVLGEMLVCLKELADDYNLLVILCAHTTKTALADKQRWKQKAILRLEDAEETKFYGNKADIGWAVWRTLDGPTYLHLDKLKDHETMGNPGLVELEHSRSMNAFSVKKIGWDIL